jgi:hypothetical protein
MFQNWGARYRLPREIYLRLNHLQNVLRTTPSGEACLFMRLDLRAQCGLTAAELQDVVNGRYRGIDAH